MSELGGSCLPLISLFSRAWRGRSLDAFMGVQDAATLPCLGDCLEPGAEPEASSADAVVGVSDGPAVLCPGTSPGLRCMD